MLDSTSTIYEIVSENPDLAILPLGSTEQHGPHLPLCTDTVIAGEISREIARRTGAYLLPTIPITTCYEHKGKKGSIWMRPSTFYQVIQDIALGLRDQGFSKLAVFLGHWGVFIAPPAIREINACFDGITVAILPDNSTLNERFKRIVEAPMEIHAGEIETSLMLYLRENLVRKDKIEGADFVPDYPQSFLNYIPLTRLSKTGVWGEPSRASAEKGKKLFEAYVEGSIEFMNRVFSEVLPDKW